MRMQLSYHTGALFISVLSPYIKSNLVSAALLSLFICAPTFAANLYYSGESPFSELHIKGEIKKGDYNKMIKIINRQRDVPYQLSVDSPGGNVMEALKIGSFARKYLLRFESQKCNSACVFILLGSLFKSENKVGTVGLHRPKFNRDYFSKLNAQEATRKYGTLRAIVENYMLTMGASEQLVNKMFSVPSGSMAYLPKSQVYNMMHSPEGYAEWIISKCGNDLTQQEYQDLMAFQRNGYEFDKKYYSFLDSKSTRYFHCELESVRNEQMRLFNQDFRLSTNYN
jgi:hypothetical protein